MIYLLLACGESTSTEKTEQEETSLSSDWNEEKSAEYIQEMAETICEQLSSCCSPTSQEMYFSSYMANTTLSDFHPLLPPNQTLTQEQCGDTLAEMLELTWAGSWMSAVEKEEVVFIPSNFEECITDLQNSSCGDQITQALFDPTCFGFNPPSGGEFQRSFLQRSQIEEETCTPIADGFGGLYYGTCDETESFCCISSDIGCSPYPTLDVQGSCLAASKEGEACSTQDPIQLCISGLKCSIDTSTCTPQSGDLLQIGDACYNPSIFELTGTCVDSWCDLFGSAQCEPQIENGGACLYGESCISGVCDSNLSECVESTFCIPE